MDIIELASQRLQELTRSGVDISNFSVDGMRYKSRVGTLSSESHSWKGQDTHKDLEKTPSVAENLSPSKAEPVRRHSEAVDLNIEHLEETGVLASVGSRSTIAEEFRHIKRPLLDNIRKSRARGTDDRNSLIMMTSALPGEGKTFCSINLAMSMATEVDMSVLLVDADVVRCNLMRALGLQPRKGLLDVLTDPCLDLSDVLLRTNVPKLSLLAAGTSNMQSTELLASEAMDSLLREIAGRYQDRVVIFDTPPLLMTSEAKVLASCMDQIVIVVEESKTPSSALVQAFASVERCPVVMSLLNKGRNHSPDYASYYA